MSVQIPPAVLSNMSAFATTAPTSYTDQVNQLSSVLADDSKASDDDKLQAWQTLSGLLTSGSVYRAGNVTDLQNALDATESTSFAKSLIDVANRYQDKSLPQARANAGKPDFNPAQAQLDVFASFSAGDQKKLFVALGLGQTYTDLGAFKADYAKRAADTASQIAAANGQAGTDTVSLSDTARTLLAQSDPMQAAKTDDDPAKQALATLKADAPAGDPGSIALSMLRSAQEAAAKNNGQSSGQSSGQGDGQDGGQAEDLATASAPKAGGYTSGERLNTTA